MKKSIAQFRYFKDGAGYVRYSEVIRDADKELLKTKNQLFKYNDDAGKYQLVPSDESIEPGKQYFQEVSIVNYPSTLTRDSLVTGDAFRNYFPIRKIGIQSLPGTRFRFNANLDWIMIGATGLYELDLLDSSASIVDLKFDRNSLTSIHENQNAYLIIDILYEEGD